jgi:UDP-2,3-diacylglucosamine hydrolase
VPLASLPSPCYVISDAHVGVDAAGANAERALLAFLDDCRTGSLVINGDLFDFWFEWRTVIPRAGFRVLAALATLRDRGIPVLWIAGNHDCWGGDVLRRDVGVEYHVGPWEGSLAGWRARIEHGDGLRGAEDRGYRAIRPILRHPLAIRAFRWLPADLASRLASGSSNASRTYRARDKGAGLRAVAARLLTAPSGPELVVFGHSHVPALERLGSGVYANAGAWTDAPDGPGPTYLVVTPHRISLYAWLQRAEGAPPGVPVKREDSRAALPAREGAKLLDGIDRRVLSQEQPTRPQESLGVIGGDEPVRR